MDMMSLSFATILAAVAQGDVSGLDSGDPTIDTSHPSTKTTQVAKVSTYILPNIAGLWALDLKQKDPTQPNCQELYHFDRDDKMIGISGKEFTYNQYMYANTDDLPAVAVHTVYDNNEKDCSGEKIDQTGQVLLAYVKLKGNTMQWCSDPEGKKCMMTLNRVLP